MIVEFHKSFKKSFKKLPKNIRDKFKERLDLFIKDRYSELLNFHKLNGTLKDTYSINITADVRVQFYFKSFNSVIFLKIGTHNQLYN